MSRLVIAEALDRPLRASTLRSSAYARFMGSLLMLSAALALGSVRSAQADPRVASSGFYTETGMGAALILPDAGDYVAVGPAVDLRVGYEPFSWLSLGGFLGASSHRANVPPPPKREYFQLYHAALDLRLGLLWGRIGLFVDGRLGGSLISSNVLEKVEVLEPGQRFSVSYAAGAGLEYQLENRHYAFGLAGQWQALTDFAPDDGQLGGITTRLYLRYTY